MQYEATLRDVQNQSVALNLWQQGSRSMWADVDTNKDFLNYSEVAELAIDVIQNPLMRPVSIGIFGTWGTGKSTLLNLVEAGLQKVAPEQFVVIRFDAWLYQGFDDARAALMEVIANELESASEGNETLLAKAKKLGKRVNSMRVVGLLAEGGALAMGWPTGGLLSKGVNSLASVFAGSPGADDIQNLKEAGEDVEKKSEGILRPSEKKTPPEQISLFRQDYSEVLTGLKKTLVIFIDNLDRCLPAQTIGTLEALRLFLFMKETAFVIAADEEMVRTSVSQFFKDLDARHVIDYLDKLVQVPIRLPRLGVQEVRAYLYLLFASTGVAIEFDALEALRGGLEDSLRQAWKEEPISTEQALRLLGNDIPEDVVQGFRIADRIAPLLANSTLVQGNPRIVKRMLNVIRMRTRLAKLRKMPFDEALIAKLALFERCMDSASISYLYSAISEAADGKLGVLEKLESSREDPDKFRTSCPEPWTSKVDFVRDWIALEPFLGGMDLRPAVYLSRETVPVRAIRGGLSAAAAESLTVLLRAASISSPSAKTAIGAIPAVEHAAVMSNLIAEFRKHGDWATKPDGFVGAQLLASASPEAGVLLAGLIRTVTGPKVPPWLNVIVKDAPWFKAEERR